MNRSLRCTLPFFALISLAAVRAPVPRAAAQPASQTLHVLPAGAGDQSGKDWANARAGNGGALQSAFDSLGPGGTLLVGSGTYERVKLQLNASDRTLAGHDTGGGLPKFVSDFDKARPAKSGGTLIRVKAGAQRVTIRLLRVERYAQAVVLEGRHQQLNVEDVDVDQCRDAFWLEGGATAAEPGAGSRDLVLRGCDVTRFTKRGFRIFGGVERMWFLNCTADAGGKEYAAEKFPIGFHLEGNDEAGIVDRDVHFFDCAARNAYNDAGPKGYWNGDGFAAERRVRGITFTRCVATGNTDGGWDLKAADVALVDCVAVDNKRNFRFWHAAESQPVRLTNCLAAYATDRGGRRHDLNFWASPGSQTVAERCTFTHSRVAIALERDREADDVSTPASLQLSHCILAVPAGGKLISGPDDARVAKVETIESAEPGDANDPQLVNPRAEWLGGGDAFDSKRFPDRGYRGKRGQE